MVSGQSIDSIEASFREVDIQDRVIDVAGEGGKDVVAVVVIHQLVRAVGLAPGIKSNRLVF